MMPPGTILIVSGERTPFPSCAASLLHCLRPQGTKIDWRIGISVAANMNGAIRDMAGDWLWIMGDDHTFGPDTLIRLLELDLDIVVPICCRRQPPLTPVWFGEEATPGRFRPINWFDLPETGTMELGAAGNAGMLIRRHVLEQMSDPWFEVGKNNAEELGEDLYFCKKARQAGFLVHGTVNVILNHLTTVCLRPVSTGRGWTVDVDLGDQIRARLPVVPGPVALQPGTITSL
jgi:hypothetical protein